MTCSTLLSDILSKRFESATRSKQPRKIVLKSKAWIVSRTAFLDNQWLSITNWSISMKLFIRLHSLGVNIYVHMYSIDVLEFIKPMVTLARWFELRILVLAVNHSLWLNELNWLLFLQPVKSHAAYYAVHSQLTAFGTALGRLNSKHLKFNFEFIQSFVPLRTLHCNVIQVLEFENSN